MNRQGFSNLRIFSPFDHFHRELARSFEIMCIGVPTLDPTEPSQWSNRVPAGITSFTENLDPSA
jgi:hypothetical protein